MPVQFGGSLTNTAPAAPQPTQQIQTPQQPAPAPAAPPPGAISQQASVGLSKPNFLMTGQKTHEALAVEQAKSDAAREEAGKSWRFFIRTQQIGQEFPLTFIDGHLEGGLLQMPSWYEHSLMLDGRVQHFVCTNHEEPCPICNGGDTPTLVTGFTVIDHTPYTVKGGDKAGQVIEVSRKLYVAKKATAAKLQLFATKYSGLNGWKFAVQRSQKMAPNVGDVFMPLERWSPEELQATYGDLSKPADWSEELTYYPAAELIKRGVAEAVRSNKASGQGQANSGPAGPTGPKTNLNASAF